ncbi:hypothetical protein BGZ72_009447 [Mortierella alpina]|nr:hypothetical protein BGZ72_009447 [Mortierella alpina]
MSTNVLVGLDLKCLVLSGPNGNNAYAVVKSEGTHVLVKAVIPAADPQLLKWDFVTAAWSFQESYDLSGGSASCIRNKAGELIAMGPWTGIQTYDTHTRRGFVYNPYNPLPLVEGRETSNALWMAVDVATNINNYENEWAQLVIDTDEDDSSALEVVLTRSQISFRNLRASEQVRELVGLGGWMLPRPLLDTSTAQLQYSNNSLFVFTAYGANDTSLMRIPFDPKSTPSSQNLTELPTGTMPIDISSTVNKCNWSDGYATALSNNKFYILCQLTTSAQSSAWQYQ